MKRTALIRHLQSHNCSLVREGARHAWWQNEDAGKRTAVPRHSEIPDPLARKICKDLGIEVIGR